ncbi:hypothetical protein [Halodesulfovibrio aestuarii]|uniref:hypothetical protein n=1 Tax=Halodesulfovibrio aestuarii TaxID=126333 RepID=UPI003D348639
MSSLLKCCSIPRSCVHAIKLDATYTDNNGPVTIHKEYVQNRMLDDVYLYDTTGKGATLTIELIGKECVTANPDCPCGVLYTSYFAKKIKAGVPFKETLNFPKVDSKISKFINFIDFIEGCVLGKLASLPAVKYDLKFSECNGEEGLGELFKVIPSGNETALSKTQKGKIVSSSKVILFPALKWDIEAELALSRGIEEKVYKRRKSKVKIVETKKKTKRTLISLQGNTSLTIGDTPHKFTKKMAEKDYISHSRKSQLITSLKNIKKLSESFTKGDDINFQVVKTAFYAPHDFFKRRWRTKVFERA